MLLQLKKLSKTFVTSRLVQEVFTDIDLMVAPGEFVCFLGPSGCGKTTLLRVIAGLEPKTSGSVLLRGQEVTRTSSDSAVVFQEPRLFPWLTVEENIAFGLKGSLSGPQLKNTVQANLKLVGLESYAHANPHELSGGMAQRVALARALATNPQLLLLDEPFSALDAITRIRMQDEIMEIWQATGKTMIMVTHDLEEAMKLGQRIFVISSSPGRIVGEFKIKNSGLNGSREQEEGLKKQIMLCLSL